MVEKMIDKIFTPLGASNHSKEFREENDFYATDPKAIDYLLKKETFNKNIWECCSGMNHLANRLEEYGYNVKKSDLVKRTEDVEVIDFLKYQGKFEGDIITNPPYKNAKEVIIKALEIVGGGKRLLCF